MQGPALFKHGGKYYAFSSWGSMGSDYTIRVCRSDNPRGPYVDKDGVSCLDFDAKKKSYGSSVVLGFEGEQSVPGPDGTVIMTGTVVCCC